MSVWQFARVFLFMVGVINFSIIFIALDIAMDLFYYCDFENLYGRKQSGIRDCGIRVLGHFMTGFQFKYCKI